MLIMEKVANAAMRDADAAREKCRRTAGALEALPKIFKPELAAAEKDAQNVREARRSVKKDLELAEDALYKANQTLSGERAARREYVTKYALNGKMAGQARRDAETVVEKAMEVLQIEDQEARVTAFLKKLDESAVAAPVPGAAAGGFAPTAEGFAPTVAGPSAGNAPAAAVAASDDDDDMSEGEPSPVLGGPAVARAAAPTSPSATSTQYESQPTPKSPTYAAVVKTSRPRDSPGNSGAEKKKGRQ